MTAKVGFFKSIHFKLILITVLLVMLALQIIGVYFVQKLEEQLLNNLSSSMNDRMNLLVYNVEQEFSHHEATVDEETVESNLKALLHEYNSLDINEVRIIDSNSKILGTSDPNNQYIVGQRTTDVFIKRTILTGERSEKIFLDQETGQRIKVMVAPVKVDGDNVAVVYLMSSLEENYELIAQVNKIFLTGMTIALLISIVVSIMTARTITHPISDMRKQALELSKGNFTRKVQVYDDDEIGQLADAFNTLTERLKEANDITEDERKKLRSVLKNMSDGVIATDRTGKIILANEPAVRMIGKSRYLIINQKITDILQIQDAYNMDELLHEVDSLLLDFSTDKNKFFLRANFSVIQSEYSGINGLIVVLYDVTEDEAIDRERREFVANVSHELRTPLTTMRSYLEALSDGVWKDEEMAPRFLQVTQNETERMIRLVTDLLSLSKMDSQDYRLYAEWYNFTAIYSHVIDRFELSKPQSIIFHREFSSEESLFVWVDQDKMIQVLDNIISNAIKYSPDGGNLYFYLMKQDDFIHVEIKDEGLGVPKDQLKQIFDRFHRVDKARSREMGGTGLGLALAKEIVEAHGGGIWAESIEGKGTSIHFIIPVGEGKEDEL